MFRFYFIYRILKMFYSHCLVVEFLSNCHRVLKNFSKYQPRKWLSANLPPAQFTSLLYLYFLEVEIIVFPLLCSRLLQKCQLRMRPVAFLPPCTALFLNLSPTDVCGYSWWQLCHTACPVHNFHSTIVCECVLITGQLGQPHVGFSRNVNPSSATLNPHKPIPISASAATSFFTLDQLVRLGQLVLPRWSACIRPRWPLLL